MEGKFLVRSRGTFLLFKSIKRSIKNVSEYFLLNYLVAESMNNRLDKKIFLSSKKMQWEVSSSLEGHICLTLNIDKKPN